MGIDTKANLPAGKPRLTFTIGTSRQGRPTLFVTEQEYAPTLRRYITPPGVKQRQVALDSATKMLADMLEAAQ